MGNRLRPEKDLSCIFVVAFIAEPSEIYLNDLIQQGAASQAWSECRRFERSSCQLPCFDPGVWEKRQLQLVIDIDCQYKQKEQTT